MKFDTANVEKRGWRSRLLLGYLSMHNYIRCDRLSYA